MDISVFGVLCVSENVIGWSAVAQCLHQFTNFQCRDDARYAHILAVASEPIRHLASGVPLYKVVRQSTEYYSCVVIKVQDDTTYVFSLYNLHYFHSKLLIYNFLHFRNFFTVSFEI